MRTMRFTAAGTIRQGVLDPSHPVEGADTRRSALGRRGGSAQVRPSTIVAIGLNERDHAAEGGTPLPDEPDVSRKPRPAPSDPSRTPW